MRIEIIGKKDLTVSQLEQLKDFVNKLFGSNCGVCISGTFKETVITDWQNEEEVDYDELSKQNKTMGSKTD